MLSANLRGEMCGGKSEQPNKLAEWDLVDAVARTLHVTSPQELNNLGGVLFPAMLNNAIIRSDISKLDELKGFVSIIFFCGFVFNLNSLNVLRFDIGC